MIVVVAGYRCRCWGTCCIFFIFKNHGRKIGHGCRDLKPGPERRSTLVSVECRHNPMSSETNDKNKTLIKTEHLHSKEKYSI